MIQIYDTTLRDGTQRAGISLSAADKIRVAHRLDELGVAFIEGGWPGSNPKDVEFFDRARDLPWRTAAITAFGATCRVQGSPDGDANIQALLNAHTAVCTVVGKTWTMHVTDVLRTTLEDNLRIIEESLAYLRAEGRRVIANIELRRSRSQTSGATVVAVIVPSALTRIAGLPIACSSSLR